MQQFKRLLMRKATPSVVQMRFAWPKDRLRLPKRRRKPSATLPDLPAELWTTIWLLLPMRDRVRVSHVSKTWRDRAIAAASLWTEFEYSEVDSQGGNIPESDREKQLDVFRTFLERSLSCPIALSLHLSPFRGPRVKTRTWTPLMRTINEHRHRIFQLSLRCVPPSIVDQLIRGLPFPMLAGPGGRLEWLRDGRYIICSPLELATMTGGPGPRCLRLLSNVAWPNDWTYNSTVEWLPLPGVEELGPLVLNSPDHMRVVFGVFHRIKVLHITIHVEEADTSAPENVLLLFSHLRALRLRVMPRSSHPMSWTYDVLPKVLPATTSDIEALEIDLPASATDGEVARPVFALFSDFDFALGQDFSLDVSTRSHRRTHGSGNLHVWTLSSTADHRRRSVALPENMSSKAANAFWAAIVVSAAPTIRKLRVPVSVLSPLLNSADAFLSSIESLEVEFVTGILTDLLRNARHHHQRLILPLHLEPELTPRLLPPLPQLKKLVLGSRFTDSERVRLNAESVLEIVQAFCPQRTLAELDVSSIRTDGWTVEQVVSVKKVTGHLICA